MRRLIIILFCALGIQLYAVEYTPFAAPTMAPAAAMHSVNNTTHMASGSAYTPTVYAVGSSAPSRAGVRKAPPSTDPTKPSDFDPTSPNYGPVGDALIPLMLMALAFVGYTYLRRRKQTN